MPKRVNFSFLLLLLLLLFSSCDEGYRQELGGISLEISNKYFLTRLTQQNDTLYVDLTMTRREYISKEKQALVRLYVLRSIIEEHKISHFNQLCLFTIELEDHKNHTGYCGTREEVIQELNENPADPAWDKWAVHLIKNITGEEIEKI